MWWGVNIKGRVNSGSGASFSEAYLSCFSWDTETSKLKMKSLLDRASVLASGTKASSTIPGSQLLSLVLCAAIWENSPGVPSKEPLKSQRNGYNGERILLFPVTSFWPEAACSTQHLWSQVERGSDVKSRSQGERSIEAEGIWMFSVEFEKPLAQANQDRKVGS